MTESKVALSSTMSKVASRNSILVTFICWYLKEGPLSACFSCMALVTVAEMSMLVIWV